MWTGNPQVCSLEIGKHAKDLKKTESGDCPFLLNRVTFEILVAYRIAKVQSSPEIISGQKLMALKIIELSLP